MKILKRPVWQRAHPSGCMAKGCVLKETIFFLCEFPHKYFDDSPWLRDEERASYNMDGEEHKSNGVQVYLGK